MRIEPWGRREGKGTTEYGNTRKGEPNGGKRLKAGTVQKPGPRRRFGCRGPGFAMAGRRRAGAGLGVPYSAVLWHLTLYGVTKRVPNATKRVQGGCPLLPIPVRAFYQGHCQRAGGLLRHTAPRTGLPTGGALLPPGQLVQRGIAAKQLRTQRRKERQEKWDGEGIGRPANAKLPGIFWNWWVLEAAGKAARARAQAKPSARPARRTRPPK